MKIHPFIIAVIGMVSCQKQDAIISVANVLAADAENAVGSKAIQFSGYTWDVRHSPGKLQGPGENYWNKNNVWVDAKGYLHLIIHRDSVSGKWYCGEVTTQQSFGYGRYQFWVDGRIDKFDKNVVLGLFNYSGNDGFDEMDIEIARWGNKTYPNLNYTIWPAQTGFNNFSYVQEFSLNGTHTTHRFTRTENSVKLQSLHGFYNDDTNEYATATCTNPPNSISKLAMPVHINFWLFKGHAPSNGKDVEIIIRKFTFTP